MKANKPLNKIEEQEQPKNDDIDHDEIEDSLPLNPYDSDHQEVSNNNDITLSTTKSGYNLDNLAQLEREYTKDNANTDQINKIPLDKRLKSKKWNERISAYKELNQLITNNQDYTTYKSIFKKLCSESNISALYESLLVVSNLIKSISNQEELNELATIWLNDLFNKVISCSRANIKKQAIENILLLVEYGLSHLVYHCDYIVKNHYGK